MALHMLHPATIAGTQIKNCQMVAVNYGATQTPLMADGEIEGLEVFQNGARPAIQTMTYDLAAAFALLCPNNRVGGNAVNGVISGAVTAYHVLQNTTGGKSSSNAVTAYLASALTFFRRISCRTQGICTATLESMGYATDIVTASGQSASAFTRPTGVGYTINDVTLNGTSVGKIQSVDIDFAIVGNPTPSGNDIIASDILIASIVPIIRLTTLNAPAAVTASTGGSKGLALNGSTGAVIALQKRAAGGAGLVATSTAAHIKLTALRGTAYAQTSAANQGQATVTNIEIVCVAGTGSSTMTVDTAATI